MPLAADVIAIGVFRPTLAEALNRAHSTVAGAPVVERLFHDFGLRGSTASHALAECLHVSTWVFGTHHFDPHLVDLVALAHLVGEAEAERFRVLRDHDFRFIFRPNG